MRGVERVLGLLTLFCIFLLAFLIAGTVLYPLKNFLLRADVLTHVPLPSLLIFAAVSALLSTVFVYLLLRLLNAYAPYSFRYLLPLVYALQEKFRRLREQEASVFENSGAALSLHEAVYDEAGEVIDLVLLRANREWERTRGKKLEEVVGKRTSEILPRDHAAFLEVARHVLSSGESFSRTGFSQDYGRYYAVTIFKAGEHVVGVSSIDITDTFSAYEQISLLADVLKNIPDAVLVTDTQGNIVYVNEAFEKITGYTLADAVGRTPRILKSGQHPAEMYEELWQTLRDGKTWRRRITNRKNDGSLWRAEVAITPLWDADGVVTHYVEVLRDVTAQEKQEQQIKQGQRLEALGQLAAGIAHDFNNALTSIIGFTEISLPECRKGSTLERNLENVLVSALRARDLVYDILTFARKKPTAPVPLSLPVVVEQVTRLLKTTTSSHVHWHVSVDKDCPWVLLEPAALEQVVMNLCLNAVQALPESGGEIHVEVKKVHVDASRVKASVDLPEGDYAFLSVKDNGCGMDAATMERIFDPFFTTKPGGTGLGLANVYGTVRQSGGTITVYSVPGEGTEFRVYLPPTQAKVSSTLVSNVIAPLGRGEHVFVLDDDLQVASALRLLCEGLGYNAVAFTDPDAALTYLREPGERIQIFLVDQVMPKMTGLEFIERVRGLGYNAPFVLVTGLKSQYEEAAMRAGAVYVLGKPVQRHELAFALAAALDTLPHRSRSEHRNG
jgi:PAS domain S-box-containing protein